MVVLLFWSMDKAIADRGAVVWSSSKHAHGIVRREPALDRRSRLLAAVRVQ
jgi:hypothetical protein